MLEIRRAEPGLISPEIARRLNIPTATVHTELHRLRVLGFDVGVADYNGARPRVEHRVSNHQTIVLGRELAKRGVSPPTAEAA